MWKYVETAWQRGHGDGRLSVDKLFSIIQRAKWDFRSFQEMLKSRWDCAGLVQTRSVADAMNARFTRKFVDVKSSGGSLKVVLYTKDVLEILLGQVSIAGKEVFFGSDESSCSSREVEKESKPIK